MEKSYFVKPDNLNLDEYKNLLPNKLKGCFNPSYGRGLTQYMLTQTGQSLCAIRSKRWKMSICIVSKNKKVDFLPAPAAVVTLPANGPAGIIVLSSWVFSATPHR